MYINLTMTYQDVPYLTEPLTLENAECAKTDRETIVENVMADLKNCVDVLPQEMDRGRVNKGAALAILGRMALYNEKWEDAIAAYREIMKIGYSLHADYDELFTQAGETSNEIIFAVRYEGPGLGEGASFNGHWNLPVEALNGTIDLADAFYVQATGLKTTDTNYGVMNNGVLDLTQPNAVRYEGRDPRLYTTLFVPGMYWNGKGGEDAWYGGASPSLSTIYVMKYFDDTDTNNSWDNGQDCYVVRYAEVLLSLAEALVQSGNYDETEVRDLVNQVRQRPSTDMPALNSGPAWLEAHSKEEVFERIVQERAVELACEGHRFSDLRRWGLAMEKLNFEYDDIRGNLRYVRVFTERDYLWPVPAVEFERNTNLGSQNPGW